MDPKDDLKRDPKPKRSLVVPDPIPPSGFRAKPWSRRAGPPSYELCPVSEPTPLTNGDFLYCYPLKERVYGVLVCDADHRCIRIRTRYELMDSSGNREPYTVELREDHVSILTVNGHLVRQVWTGYVRSLCLVDLVAAIPAAAALVDELRVDAARDEFVRTVITEAVDRFAQEVEVASVMGLLMAAARIGFDARVEGRPFWE